MEILLKKHAILFVHGWATDGRVWKEHVDYFSQKRTVINMVLPGHGSEKKWDSKTIEPAVLAIKEAIEGYEGKTIGIGWSLGAQSLIASAALNPGAFEKLVLVGATPCFTIKQDFQFGQPLSLARRMISGFKRSPRETLKSFYPLNFTAAELRTSRTVSLVRDFEQHPLIDAGGLTQSLEMLYTLDIRDMLGLINIPTLVIHGGLDAVTDVEAGRFLASHIRDAGFIVFETSGHAPFITEPERFKRVVADFIEGSKTEVIA